MTEITPKIQEENINLIRALAVSSVYCFHASAYQDINIPILGDNGGLFGIFLFFMISGYLLAKSAEKHRL